MNYFFKPRDISLAHVIGASCVTFAVYRGHYIVAVILFVLAVVICAAGELALERR